MSKVEKIVDSDFERSVLASDQPVVVDFYADWCPPCKRLAPILDRFAVEYEGRVKFVKVNTDEQQAWAGRLGVRSLPTLVFFKDGQAVDAKLGLQHPDQLRMGLDKLAS